MTAHQYLIKKGVKSIAEIKSIIDIQRYLEDFATLHVKLALEAGYNNCEFNMESTTDHSELIPIIIKESIINSYPLTNIKDE